MPKRRYTLAERLRDPNKRARLPASMLSPKQRSQRQINQRIAKDNANPLFDPTATLSGHALSAAAAQVANMELEPQIGAVDRQYANERAQGKALASRGADYYRALAERELQSVNRRQSINDALKADLGRVGQSSRAALDSARANEDQRQQADAQSRGSGLQGTDQAAQELAAARANGTLAQAQAESTAATQSGNWSEYMNGLMQARQSRGAEVQGELANREASRLGELSAKRADLESQRGATKTKALLDLRNTQFENLATREGLGIKQADLVQQGQTQRANRKVKYAGIRTTAKTNAANRASRERTAAETRAIERDRLAETRRHNVVQENKPARQEKETAASLKMRRDISSARGTWRRLMTKFHGDEGHVKRHLIEVMGIPPAAYNAIYDLERSGTLNPRNAKALTDDLGVMVPTGWMRKAKRPAAAKAPH